MKYVVMSEETFGGLTAKLDFATDCLLEAQNYALYLSIAKGSDCYVYVWKIEEYPVVLSCYNTTLCDNGKIYIERDL